MSQHSIEELIAARMAESLERMFREAYEQGVRDGRGINAYPHLLTKEHLSEIFSVEVSTVNKIITHPTFPKFKEVRARYPRDQVFQWIDEHSTLIDTMKGAS